MIDTHAHLNFKDFDKDRDEVISRAFQGGIKKIINIGTDLKESEKSIKLAEKYENIYAAVGLHPDYFSGAEEITSSQPKADPPLAEKLQIPNTCLPVGRNLQITKYKIKKSIEELRKLAKNKKVVAIGEIGLDYFSHDGKLISEQQKEIQKEGFIAQLKLAKELNLSVIIHCRASKENPTDAYDDLYEFISKKLKAKSYKLVMHCYGGDLKFTKKLLKHKNIYFSFTGNITYKMKKEIQGTKDDIAESIKIIPLERIMLETDCPFLAPQKFRGKRNEPAFVKYTAEKLAEIKKVSFEKVDKITTRTAEEFFGI